MINKKILVSIFVVVFLTLIGCLPAPPNQAPVITSTPVTTAEVGVPYTYNVDATDPDGDTLTYTLDIKPTDMSISSTTGLINWIPAAAGDYAVVVKVSDGDLDITQSFTIAVIEEEPNPTPVNHAPVINSSPITDAVMGVAYTYDVDATDPDGDTLTYSLAVKPFGMGINSANGVISWIPTAEGVFAVEVKVSDGALSDTQNFTITVQTVEIFGIEVLPETMTLVTGTSETIQSVTALYNIKADFEVPIPLGDCTYDSDNPAIATVLLTPGLITAFQEGTATITVGYAGMTDTVEVTVVLPVHNITQDEYYMLIQVAINDADPGDTIEVAPGTYNENIIIDKSLTVVSAEGPEVTTINAQGVPIAVLINVANTVVTFEGFTVTNYNTLGIQAGLPGPVWQPDPLEVHILNNIVEAPLSLSLHTYNIHFSFGATGTVIGNEASGLGDPAWANLGIHGYCTSDVFVSNNYVHDCLYGIWIVGCAEYKGRPAAENNKIESNLVENCKTGITVQHNSIGTIIRYNDVLNNDVGIESVASDQIIGSSMEHSTPSGTEIHQNNIVGNELYGVQSFIVGSDTGTVLAEEVDATYNWWGSEYGPKHNGFPLNGGDAVSDNVDYSNWSIVPN